jgi:radical SAM protein with 4Fe4S-binding SPASM domain
MTLRQENLGQEHPMLRTAADLPCISPSPPVRLIAGLEFSEEDVLATVRRNGLLSIELEMTRLCNLGCLYCYSHGGTALPDEMSLHEIKDVVMQALALGGRKIVVLGGGEPLMYEPLRELIEFIACHGLHIEMFTNGTLIDADTASFLYRHNVSVVVKRNSLDGGVQDELAGRQGTFERIERGLSHLFACGYPDADHGLGIQTIICRQNLREIPDLWRQARQRGIQPYFECMTYQGRATANADLQVSADEAGRLFRALQEIDNSEFGRRWSPHPPLAGAKCQRHLYSLLIKANGDIFPCVGVDVATGNIRHSRLADVISSSQVIQDLRHVYSNIHGACRTCRMNGECYGCRGNAYQMTGDYLSSDPFCWIPNDDRGERRVM